MTTLEERNLAAEVRGVEEGHRAFLVVDDDDGPYLRVVSDSHPNKAYMVKAVAFGAGERVQFTCKPMGNKAYEDDHLYATQAPGFAPCKHAAVAARRLEREGLLVWQGGAWYTTEQAEDILYIHHNGPEDPFEGLS